MFFIPIPGILISVLTFPGVIFHEWAHKKYCELLNVRVYEACYFQFENPVGFVTHEYPKKFNQAFWISIGPFIINSLITVILSWVAYNIMFPGFITGLLLWVALSSGMHAIPSDEDAKIILEIGNNVFKNDKIWIYIIFIYPLYRTIWVINNILRFLWFDLWYAIALIFWAGIM